jgi:hypothetical protein
MLTCHIQSSTSLMQHSSGGKWQMIVVIGNILVSYECLVISCQPFPPGGRTVHIKSGAYVQNVMLLGYCINLIVLSVLLMVSVCMGVNSKPFCDTDMYILAWFQQFGDLCLCCAHVCKMLLIIAGTETTHPEFQGTVPKMHLKSRVPKLGWNVMQSTKQTLYL